MSLTDLPDSTAALLLVPFLLIAMVTDLLDRRIPNVLVMAMLAFGLALQLATFSATALLWSVGGVVVGLLMLLPFYVLGGMGAGDVKLLAAAGSFLGPMGALVAGAFTLLAGGVLAVLWIAGSRLGAYAARRSPAPARPAAERLYMPYSLAITAGTLMAIINGTSF